MLLFLYSYCSCIHLASAGIATTFVMFLLLLLLPLTVRNGKYNCHSKCLREKGKKRKANLQIYRYLLLCSFQSCSFSWVLLNYFNKCLRGEFLHLEVLNINYLFSGQIVSSTTEKNVKHPNTILILGLF